MPHRFSVEEYYRMADFGILTEDDRVELLDGCIIVREPASPPHAGHTIGLNVLFSRLLMDRAFVSVQNPLAIDEYNHPQPDLAILRPRDDLYTTSHPTAGDILLLVEVALASLPGDHRHKVSLYATAAIPELWIVNLVDGLVEVYREPSEDGYRRILRLGSGAPLSVEAFADVELSVDDVIRSSTTPS